MRQSNFGPKVFSALALLFCACSGADGGAMNSFSGGAGSSALATGGNGSTGGSATSGLSTGGSVTGFGGTSTSVGGSTVASSGEATSAGGTVTGGSSSSVLGTGGKVTGGAASTGGVATGGKATGGAASTGGVATGGITSGGTSSTGGSSTGDTNVGGKATGGTLSTGGVSTGGKSTGGAATGGAQGTTGVVGTPVGFCTLNGGTTGGLGGQKVTVTTYADLKAYAESTTAYIIMVQGTISNGAAGGKVSVKSNKSIVGVGSTAFLSGVGLDINSANNIIIQNLKATLVGTTTPSSVNGGDVIGISGTSKNIWIDHCEFYSENPDVQTDIDLYDGLVDIKAQTGFICISWSYLHDHHKGGLVGAADDDLYADRKVTFHHNYYNKVKLRVPMYRGAVGHFFNNYIVGATDATEIRAGTCVRV